MSESVNPNPKTGTADQLVFGPVGHCIYCGATDVRLGREHVMPFGMHGEMVLLKSSCDACAKITGGIENFVLGRMLVNLRIRYGLKSRKKSKNTRPRDFAYTFKSLVSKKVSNRRVGKEYLPWYSYSLPRYDLPGLILQKAPSECAKGDMQVVLSKFDAEVMLGLGNGVEAVGSPDEIIDLRLFNRFLAKVAHSYMCATIGEECFRPCLNSLILNGDEHDTFWVGSEEVDPPHSPNLFEISHGEYKSWNGSEWLAVRIRLFSFLGTPSYVVAVGQRRCDKQWLLQQPGYALPMKVLIKDADGVPIFSCGV